jgi:radical SAM protein with 4Fe4S-binding SPASM domain
VALEEWRRAGGVGARPATSNLNDGRGFVFISHTGEVCPSGFLPIIAGNVRDSELIDIYRDAPLFRSLRDPAQLVGKCGRCPYRLLCGGSRARSFAMTGDPLASDPLCAFEPADEPAAVA